jgi:hypothetical protein
VNINISGISILLFIVILWACEIISVSFTVNSHVDNVLCISGYQYAVVSPNAYAMKDYEGNLKKCEK